jgi:hypothetical protein
MNFTFRKDPHSVVLDISPERKALETWLGVCCLFVCDYTPPPPSFLVVFLPMPRREKRMTEPRMRTRRMEKLSLASRSSSVVPPTGSPICSESVLQGKVHNEYQAVAQQRVYADDDIFSHLYKNNVPRSHSGTGREVNLAYIFTGRVHDMSS